MKTPEAPSILEIRNLVKIRTQGEFAFHLHVPQINVGAGTFVAIVGESGCGKSTLLDMLGLILSPTSADCFTIHPAGLKTPIDVLSKNASSLADVRRTCLGYILQTGGLLPYLRVHDNIRLTNQLSGRYPGKKHLLELCTRLGIQQQLGKFPAHLSGGQRQRVAIARALVHQPPIVLADEPTAAVDKVTAREIRNTFKELTRELGTTVLMVTHDLDLVEGIADRKFTFRTERLSETVVRSECYEVEQTPASK